MRALNRTEVQGIVTSKVTVQQTQAGKSVANFRLEVRETFTSGKSFSTRFRVTAWDQQIVDFCAGVPEGAEVYAVGRIGTEEPYQGKDGKWYSSLTLNADTVFMVVGAPAAAANPAAQVNINYNGRPQAGQAPLSTGSVLDDIPF